MPVYEFTAVETGGRKRAGRTTSPSVTELTDGLRREGVFLIEAREARRAPASAGLRLSAKTLADFTERLEILVKAGFPLADALAQIARDTQDSRARRVFESLTDIVTGGVPLSEALDRHPRIFDETYRAVVAAGEHSGTLEQVLARLSENLLWRMRIATQVRGALTYPALVCVALSGLIALILLFLVPRVMVIFDKARVAPPPATVALLATSNFVSSHWMVIAGSIVAFTAAFAFGLRMRGFRRLVQEATFRLPFVGQIVTLSESATFVHVLGLLNSSGITVARALLSAGAALRTERMKTAVAGVLDAVTRGNLLSDAVRKAGAFPSVVVQMVAAGEKSGALDDALARARAYLDREIPRAVSRIIALLGPTLTVITGVAVGFAVYTVVSPMTSVLSALHGAPR